MRGVSKPDICENSHSANTPFCISMTDSPNRDPLHGITLKTMLTELQEKLGWEAMGNEIRIKCFTHDPSLSSSLKFLRRTPWAREKVEALYIRNKASDSAVWQQAQKRRQKTE